MISKEHKTHVEPAPTYMGPPVLNSHYVENLLSLILSFQKNVILISTEMRNSNITDWLPATGYSDVISQATLDCTCSSVHI